MGDARSAILDAVITISLYYHELISGEGKSHVNLRLCFVMVLLYISYHTPSKLQIFNRKPFHIKLCMAGEVLTN